MLFYDYKVNLAKFLEICIKKLILNSRGHTRIKEGDTEIISLEVNRKSVNEIHFTDIKNLISTPPNVTMGDYAFPCFKLAKLMNLRPIDVPERLAKVVNKEIANCGVNDMANLFSRAVPEGPFLNFFADRTELATHVLHDIDITGPLYGSQGYGKGQKIVIDYSSPNIAKPFHVGHLRSTVIGNALKNIYNTLGYKVVGINHLGDWGTQFGKLIVAYKNWGNKEDVEARGIECLNELYVKFHEEAETNEVLNNEARGWLVKMQEGDAEALELWKWFNDISMVEFNNVYGRLGIHFDHFTGESFYNDKMDAVVEELKEKELLEESNGAMVVNLDDTKMPPCLILRSDGGTLYPTRDIAASIYRNTEYDFLKCLYVTASDQNLHFAQWFEVVKKMRLPYAERLHHIPFGLVSLESGKLSTRQGNVILMNDLLDEAVSKTLSIINEKNPDLQNKKEVAEEVGIGAMIFNDLYNSRIKNVTFSWEQMLNFTGETGPYVQYTHARCASIIRKAYTQHEICLDYPNVEILVSNYEDTVAYELIKALMDYKSKIVEASEKDEPYIISRQLILICQHFNKFYDHQRNILGAEPVVRDTMIYLITCTKQVLSNGLKILGMKAPQEM